jgi:hypothetical protein
MNRLVLELCKKTTQIQRNSFQKIIKNTPKSNKLRYNLARFYSSRFQSQINPISSPLRNQIKFHFSETNSTSETEQETRPNEENSEYQENERNEEDEEEEFNEDEHDYDESSSKSSSLLLKYLIFFGILGSGYYYLDNYYYEDSEIPLYKFWFNKYFSFIYKPNLEEFLSMDPPLHPNIKPKTLIISFENMLYYKNYEAGSGIVIDLRPGLRDFLKDLSRKYEIILFSDEDSQFMEEVISTVDPYHMFLRSSFGREFFTMHRGRYVKDYDYFNRDFRNVIIVDFNKKQNYNKHENLVIIDKYNGEETDNSLNDLKSFLIHCHKYDDVRKVISNFGGTGSVQNFIEQKTKYTQKLQKKKGFIESLFGKK